MINLQNKENYMDITKYNINKYKNTAFECVSDPLCTFLRGLNWIFPNTTPL